MMGREAYLQQLQALLPTGKAWNRERNSNLTGMLAALASELSLVHDRATDIVKESDPRTTVEMLEEWETQTALPDVCSSGIVSTIQERRLAVLQKLTSRGGQSPKYFKELAATYGYQVTITENVPFRAGHSECGRLYEEGPYSIKAHHAMSDLNFRFIWNVKVNGPRVTWFRCSESEAGKDPLAKITRAEDLECIFNRLKPAHTKLTFAYEGV